MNGNGRTHRTPLDHALAYAARGWPVVTVWQARNGVCSCPKGPRCKAPGKHPRARHGILAATTDRKTIRGWKWDAANVGIVTGARSGLVVLDIDRRNGIDGMGTLKELNDKLGRLPPCPMQATGGDGLHLLFQHPGWSVPNIQGWAPNVDIKADGGMVLVPPSIHPTGQPYVWEISPDEVPPPTLPDSWLQWLPKGSTEAQKAQESAESAGMRRNPPAGGGREEKSVPSAAVSEMIQATQPKGPGQRWNKQWELARRLRTLPPMTDRQVISVFTQWWPLAAPKTSGTHSYEEALAEFINAYHSVRLPWGTNFMTVAFEKAEVANPPQAVAKFPTPEFRTLAAFCRELQHEVGEGKPFFLSSHEAAKRLGKHPKVARIGELVPAKPRGRAPKGHGKSLGTPSIFASDTLAAYRKVARIGELVPAKPREETGRGHKSGKGGLPLFAKPTLATYRKVDRIGELVPAEKGGRGKNSSGSRTGFFGHNTLATYRKVARIGELVPATSAKERGAKGGRGRKAPKGGLAAFSEPTLAAYRKVARIGELVPAKPRGRAPKGHGKSSGSRTNFFGHNTLATYRKVARIGELVPGGEPGRGKKTDNQLVGFSRQTLGAYRKVAGQQQQTEA